MSETNISIQNLIPNGKISTRTGEITPQYVTAVSRIYLNRADGDQEYMIEETGIVERSACDSLAKCYVEASKMAYQNAVSRLMDNGTLLYDTKQQEAKVPAAPVDEKTAFEPEASKEPENRASTPESEPEKEPDGEPADDGEPTLFTETDDGQQESTIRKVDLNLVTASSLTGSDTGTTEDDGDDPVQKAREIQITILGKAHDCYNWTAGKILDELPEVIVKFAHRYSGENKVEKEAFLALYPEAVRRCEKAS